MSKFKRNAQSIAEYLMAALFIYGGIVSAIAEPVSRGGVLVLIFGGEGALAVYTILFAGLGIWLIFAKVAKKKKQHKFALFGMFLSALYTVVLVLALGGVFLDIVDNLIAVVACAILWLRWKFITEYVDPDEFNDFVLEHRDDLPPETP